MFVRLDNEANASPRKRVSGLRRDRLERERGAALVELALVVVLLLPLLLSIVEFGRALFTLHVLQTAAREGARVCALSIGTPAERMQEAQRRIEQVVENTGIAVGPGDIEWPDRWGYGVPLKVVVRHQFETVAATFLPALEDGIPLEGTAVFNQELPNPESP